MLRADVKLPSGKQLPADTIGIARVSIADYLGQDGIVVATDGNRVRPARQHRWAEPLDSAIRLYLRDAISAETGYPISADTSRRLAWDYRIDIRVDEWHGSLAGDVRILASWTVADATNENQIMSHRFEQTVTLQDDGYDALVASQEELLMALAGAIAASLDGLNL